jgi:hypothetical protein
MMEDMNPRIDEGGDEYLTPLNMATSEDEKEPEPKSGGGEDEDEDDEGEDEDGNTKA